MGLLYNFPDDRYRYSNERVGINIIPSITVTEWEVLPIEVSISYTLPQPVVVEWEVQSITVNLT